MFAEAFASIAADISSAFGGPYFDSVVQRSGEAVYDEGGSILSPGTPIELPCQVQVDSVTEAQRAADGFTDTDVRLLVLSATLAGTLDTAATIEVQGGPGAGRYNLQSVVRDPLGITYDCRARRA